MPTPTYAEATQFDNNDLFAIIVSGKNKDESDWAGMRISGDGIDTPSSLTPAKKTVTTSGTPEPLFATATPCKAVMLRALSSNTDDVFAGNADVDASAEEGYPIGMGQAVVIPIDDASKVYLDPAVSGEGVSILVLN